MNEINQISNEPVRKSRILLVDDEPGLRTAVKTFLEDEGFEIFIAVDGEDGWEKAQTVFPDLIISDIMMPRANGYALLEKIREGFLNSNIQKQILLIPEVVELTEDHFDVIIKQKDNLIKLGLVIEEFDKNTILIREHPAILDKVNFSILIKDIAEEIFHISQQKRSAWSFDVEIRPDIEQW